MKRVSLIVASNVIFLSVLLGLVLISCGERTATVTTVFTVSEDTTQYLPTTTENSYSITALALGEKISFTPTSMKVKFFTVRVDTGFVFCTGTQPTYEGPHIFVVAEEYFPDEENEHVPSFELIGKSAFESLASFSGTADEWSFDEYQSILVNAYAIISGVVNAGGTQYTFDNLKAEFGAYYLGLAGCIVMPQPFLVDEGHNPTISIIFDVENCATLENFPGSGHGTPVPGYNDIYVDLTQLVFALYGAEGDPVVDKYEVVLDSDVFGDHTTWYLKVLTVTDQEGNLADVRWHTVYREGYSGDTWEPDDLVYPLITNVEENTYSIKVHPDWYNELPGENPLEFPAFKLEDHAGTLIYDGNNYTYTATKR
jgi:hypothetical protein